MGNQQACIRPKDAKLTQNMFKVRNVDDMGSEIQRAVIEVTKTDIILHQRGKEPIKWPLRSLRRYGFDKKLFSFESGRRCATGPGIYAFKCKRAEFLFRHVQENAQACGNGRYGSSYSSSSAEAANEAASPTHQPSSPALSAFSTDSPSLAAFRNGTAYGGTSYIGRTASTASSPGAQTPSSPNASVHYINANSFPDIPESPQESMADSSSVTANLLPRLSEENIGSPSEENDPNVNYARLKHDMDEDSTDVGITETDAVMLVQNDVNGNMDRVGMPPLTMLKPTSLPESHYMKPSSVQDIVNGNTMPLKSSLSLSSNAGVISSTNSTSETVTHENQTSRASPVSITTPMSLVSQTSLTTPSSRTSGCSSYYANLDMVGELPHNNFVFCCDLRSPCSTSSSKGSGGSEFIFDGSVAGNRSPASEHSYANLDALSEVGMRSAVYNGNSSVVLQPAPKGRMNYADLDMESLEAVQTTPTIQTRQSRSSSMTSSPPKTPASLNSEGSSRRTDTYAMIDFNRTTALANSQRQIDESDLPGGPLRRTRHDSKIR
ncbi:fibroblast growth factor receptor substrate 2-like isoform X2 [Acanthaster planci]|nr:fibroblast growth factor receptor substrate 2-like isoform X2 [Acanthaster planci]XP_022112198.1 fibroblast growth factor receptor substrate 2-like isoform X2 [Acanthaster planci]XP_022112199.1 fibroblast growth factor receptor substrate 2-like isoform X2 [Acanthaster planci]XP_022112200.1 fibroblast growth factor receptor substrate 2-like isoform X2 [Acanthaster planci]XP_022112201.1 fibroblast growth factor receptor substrate 2-like isoform X2 [Acanthaster planci]XP_022112202.1 fibroblast